MTQLVYPFTLVPGQPENVNQLNSDLLAIQAVLNGNIDSTNIVANSLAQDRLDAQAQSAIADNVQQGVVGATDGNVTYGSATGVAIAAGAAWVQTASGFLRRTSWNANSITVPASTGTRLDQIVVDYTGALSRVAGTEQAAGVATLANRTGAASLPSGTLRLSDLLITTAGVVNATANIRDRRPWARGYFNRVVGSGTASYTTSSTTGADVDSTNLVQRVEATGYPFRLSFIARTSNNTASGANFMQFLMDGGAFPAPLPPLWQKVFPAANVSEALLYSVVVIPPAGSHVIKPQFGVAVGTQVATIVNLTATEVPQFVIEEIVRPNANNGTS